VLKKESLIGSEISKNKYFPINVLTNTQQKYAEYYSREREPDQVDDNNWQIENAKYAFLLNSKVIFKCELHELIDTYPTNIFVRKVIDAKSGLEDKPLIYSSRKYHETKE
jgi:flavin reductase (DIM6/NTAB) family NADH-FMN oxidoreductase RutF